MVDPYDEVPLRKSFPKPREKSLALVARQCLAAPKRPHRQGRGAKQTEAA